MNKHLTKPIVLLLGASALILVQTQLSSRRDLLAKSVGICCNGGFGDNPCNGAPCGEGEHSIDNCGAPWDGVTKTCRDCIDAEKLANPSCVYDIQYCLYGTQMYFGNSDYGISSVSISGPSTIRKSANFSVNVSGGCGTFSYQWSVSRDGGAYQSLGTGSSQTIYVDTECNLSIKCVVTNGCHEIDTKEANASATNPDAC